MCFSFCCFHLFHCHVSMMNMGLVKLMCFITKTPTVEKPVQYCLPNLVFKCISVHCPLCWAPQYISNGTSFIWQVWQTTRPVLSLKWQEKLSFLSLALQSRVSDSDLLPWNFPARWAHFLVAMCRQRHGPIHSNFAFLHHTIHSSYLQCQFN